MLVELIKFEIFYQRKQWAFLIFSTIFFLFGILLGSDGFAPANVHLNSIYQITFNTGIFTLGALFSVVFFSVSGVIRDRKYDIENILYSTAISKSHYFISRFAGVFGFTLISFTPFLVGLALGSFSPSLYPARLSEFNLWVYTWTWLILVVPNVFICSSLVYAVSLLTKNTVATYVSGVALYMMYILTSMFLNSPVMAQSVPGTPESLMLASYFDPFGLSAFFEQTQFWTPHQKNFQMISFSGYFMGNRVLWTVFSLAILVVSFLAFSFRTLSGKVKKAEKIESVHRSKKYQPVAVFVDGMMQFKSLISQMKFELKSIFISLPFLGAFGCWITIVFTEIYSRVESGGMYRDSWYPSTNLLIEQFTEPLPVFAMILIVFYAGELVWRDKGFKLNEIVDSTPVANWVLFSSKFLSLSVIPVLFIGGAILICMVFQIASGYDQLEPGLYLSTFYYWGTDLIFFCAFALFIQTMLPGKFLAMGVSGLLIIVLKGNLSTYVGIEHPMLKLSHLPIPGYTNMAGYSSIKTAFNHFALYWLAFGGILSILAFKAWNRGITEGYRHQWRLFVSNWKIGQRITLIISVAVFLTSGSLIYYNTNIKEVYRTSAERLDLREQYERSFKIYEDLPRLYHLEMKTAVDFFPEEGRYSLAADYLLKNKGESPIDRILITERATLDTISLEGAYLVQYDEEFGTFLFEFPEPVQPGGTVKMEYRVSERETGYTRQRGIVSNGSFLMFHQFEPRLGYSSGMEISDPSERRKRGLPEREIESVDDHLASEEVTVGRVSFETVISTSASQIAIAPGKLMASWEKEGRNYFHYKPSTKVIPFIAYFSADYETQVSSHNGVAIEQYYYPGHEYNLDKVEESTRMTLDYCEKYFGPFPFDHIRLAEIPGHWGFGGTAHPGTISMVEDNLYLIDVSDTSRFDLVAKRTVHEVAHQWFGGVLSPKVQVGGSLLVEGLAKYTEAAVMEKMYGKKALWQISETANQRYFNSRSYASSPEPPLYLNDNESYLDYGKSFAVMLAMKELIGEDSINKAVRTLIDRYRGQTELHATAGEFIEELYQVTPEVHHPLIDDWFKEVIVYDLKVTDVEYESLTNGQFEIKMTVQTSRSKTDESGEKEEIDLKEPIPIGLFMDHPKKLPNDQSIIYYQSYPIEGSESEITIVVDKLPKYAAIDPFGTRSDPNLYDNVSDLE